MKQLEKEITETDRKKSMERLKNYEKAIADILADVKKNENGRSRSGMERRQRKHRLQP